ncbi:prolipoprotein diacylglyceryl transferase [Jannaschia sp. Os4]|uniref:prolipoprotein diacylglyceryl transferase n=1 Tax=Jannaschia sp. Os4 TaxID=2807617 RepID=UPI00193A8056|nr:prolipoprotein diacylglyceryl transferase [Jannaschia sp. Os4]MBM2574839.1 prolipoprotein diacylglyceryl transferase [Jannaschia sp. Os4]
MRAAIPFPDIDPVAFTLSLGEFAFSLHWYALAYIAALLIGWRIAVALQKRPALWAHGQPPMTPPQVEDVMTWITLGVILGGRLGYVLFYQPAYYLQNPLEIPAVWQGGMSFHGGMLGVALAVVVWARRARVPLLSVADTAAVATPIGIGLGRLANFVNAELWGRPTDAPWGMIFPGAAAQDCPGGPLVEGGLCARHPSQLYEAGLEGVLLLAILLLLVTRGGLKRPGLATGVFLAGYGLARMAVELFREADAQYIAPDNPLGHVVRLGDLGLSMGQLLSLPMVVAGIALAAWSLRRRPAPA